MTIKEAISFLRTSLKEHTDTSAFPNGYLWEVFSAALSEVREQQIRKLKYINPNTYQTFCIEMEEGTTHMCGDCIGDIGCPALISKHPIPDYLTTSLGTTLRISTLSGQIVDMITGEDYMTAFSYDEAYRNKKYGFIENGKIVIPNKKNPKVLKVRAIWNNLLDWEDIQYCSDEANENCDIMNTDVGVNPSDKPEILKRAFRMLGIPLRLVEDNSGNNNTEIK